MNSPMEGSSERRGRAPRRLHRNNGGKILSEQQQQQNQQQQLFSLERIVTKSCKRGNTSFYYYLFNVFRHYKKIMIERSECLLLVDADESPFLLLSLGNCILITLLYQQYNYIVHITSMNCFQSALRQQLNNAQHLY